MFATFAMLPYSSTMIFFFSRIYLYLFICTFTYVILSLMISLIMDAYGTVKDSYEQGGEQTKLHQFMSSPLTLDFQRCTRHDGETSLTSIQTETFWTRCINWLKRVRADVSSPRRRLLPSQSPANSYASSILHQRLDE